MNWIALIAIVTCLLFLYIIGTIITLPLRTEDNDSCYDTFVSLVVGFLAVTTIYAIVKTGGNTVLSFIGIVAVVYWIQTRKKISFSSNGLRSILNSNVLNAFFLSLALFVYFLFFSSITSINYIPHFDDVYYTFLSTKLGNFGIETGNSVYDGGWHNASPYHYVELWFLNLLVSVFKMNPMFTYAVVERTIGCTMLAMGMITIARHFSKNKLLCILGVFSITICPFLLDYSVIEQKQCLAYRPLGMFMFCLYIWTCVLSLKKNSYWFYPLLVAPVFHMGSMPVLYSSIVVFALVKLCFNNDFKSFLRKIVPTFGMAILFVGFYFVLNSSSDMETDNSNFIDYCLQFYSISEFCRHLYANVANYAMYAPYMIPLVLLIGYNLIKNKTWVIELWNEYKELVLFFCITTCFGLMYGYFSYPLFRYDADQLHTLVNIPFLCLFAFLSILIAITNINKVKIRRVALFYVSWCLIYSTTIYCVSRINISYTPEDRYDSAYIINVADYYNTNSTTFRGGQISSDVPIFNLEVPNGYLYTPFCLKTDFMYFTNLNTYFPNDSTMYYAIENTYGDSDLAKFFKRNYPSQLKQDPFARFAKQYVDSCGETSIDTLRLAFIKKYQLGFIVCDSKTELPVGIQALVDTTFTDAKTGERFVFLRR